MYSRRSRLFRPQVRFGSLLSGTRQLPRPHFAFFVRLPPSSRTNFQGSQPATTMAIGVDADEVPEVENFSTLLWRMPDHSDLARDVRPQPISIERLPPQ